MTHTLSDRKVRVCGGVTGEELDEIANEGAVRLWLTMLPSRSNEARRSRRRSERSRVTTLAKTLTDVRARIRRLGSRRMNEENTKATLIEPVLRALGWDVEDVDEVQREFKAHSRHKPVDYGLLVVRTPRLLIEAKAFGENLGDHRWVNQIMGYASVAGVEWVVLTNGDDYRIYNTHAPVVVEEKLFRSIQVTSGNSAVEETLELLAKNRLEENRIEVLWRAHFVDRQVKAAIERLFSMEGNDMVLVNHVVASTKNLTTEEIRASIARCRVTLDFPVDLQLLVAPVRKAPKGARRTSAPEQPKPAGSATLLDLIQAGVLKAPVQVARTYKGRELVATVLPSGSICVGDEEFDSPSAAASAAMRSVSKSHGPTNGWDFWLVGSWPGQMGGRSRWGRCALPWPGRSASGSSVPLSTPEPVISRAVGSKSHCATSIPGDASAE